jgi:transposase
LYPIGVRSKISKSNLIHANNHRNWKIFYDFAQILIKETTKLYQNDTLDLKIDACIYALDSTTIDLCMTLFPWAHFRKRKSAVKMHTMINLQGRIPDFVLVSTGKMQADAVTITQVYKNRWHVELFFKWIKQHLHVKSFYGRSDNAVRSQIWIAMCVYLLLAKLKTQRELPQTLNEIQQILRTCNKIS